MKVIMLLGSGELGKEFVIAAKRMGHYVIACDSYRNAPAMQVVIRLYFSTTTATIQECRSLTFYLQVKT